MPIAVFRLSYGSGVAMLVAGLALASAVSAQTVDMTPPKLDLETFLAQSKALHNANPQAPGSLTAQGPQDLAQTGARKIAAPLPKASAEAIDRVLSLTLGDQLDSQAVSAGLATGQVRMPAIPTLQSLDRATARAVVEAFNTPGGMTAYDRAQIAATDAADPDLQERIALVRTVYRVDGTDGLVRRFVATQHMRLIITEVNNHINISALSESEKYRMAAIAAAAQTELEEKILDMDARQQAQNLSKPELMQLIAAFDSDAQRKMTQMRLTDDGKLDRAVDLEIKLAQIQIVKTFEAGQ